MLACSIASKTMSRQTPSRSRRRAQGHPLFTQGSRPEGPIVTSSLSVSPHSEWGCCFLCYLRQSHSVLLHRSSFLILLLPPPRRRRHHHHQQQQQNRHYPLSTIVYSHNRHLRPSHSFLTPHPHAAAASSQSRVMIVILIIDHLHYHQQLQHQHHHFSISDTDIGYRDIL